MATPLGRERRRTRAASSRPTPKPPRPGGPSARASSSRLCRRRADTSSMIRPQRRRGPSTGASLQRRWGTRGRATAGGLRDGTDLDRAPLRDWVAGDDPRPWRSTLHEIPAQRSGHRCACCGRHSNEQLSRPPGRGSRRPATLHLQIEAMKAGARRSAPPMSPTPAAMRLAPEALFRAEVRASPGGV